MSIFRIKDNVPQVYVSESRDFQLFTRVFDFVQNALKYDIDAMTDILSADSISDEYIDHLKSKVGFYSNNVYDDSTLRKCLSAMPHIIKNKGSKLGIEMCVNAFLNIVGFRGGSRVDVYNNDPLYNYVVRVGIEGARVDTHILQDMLSYVIPTGYFVEFYFYKDAGLPATKLLFKDSQYRLDGTLEGVNGDLISVVSKAVESNSEGDETLEDDTYGTVQLATVKNIEMD